ncbi:MAG: hypothetical protein ACI93T_004121, partial [Porticoccaceae bacterium]
GDCRSRQCDSGSSEHTDQSTAANVFAESSWFAEAIHSNRETSSAAVARLFTDLLADLPATVNLDAQSLSCGICIY